MPIRIDVLGSSDLQATLLAIRSMPTEIRKQIRQQSKRVIEPAYTEQITSRAASHPQSRPAVHIFGNTARVAVSDQNVKLKVAHTTRAVGNSKRLVPAELGIVYEFGSKRDKRTKYNRQNPGGSGTHTVTRNTSRQLPLFRSRGYVFWPTVKDLVPRIASLWMQTALRTANEVLERR